MTNILGRTDRRADYLASRFGRTARYAFTPLMIGGWLGATLLLVVTLLAGVIMPKAAFANGTGTTAAAAAITVTLTDITLDSYAVVENSAVELTLRGTHTATGSTISDADQNKIRSAARKALTLGGTASEADFTYRVATAEALPPIGTAAPGTFTITVELEALDDGVDEDTETLKLSHGDLSATLTIEDAPVINITVQELSFSVPNIAEGKSSAVKGTTSTLQVKVKHDAGIIKVGENYLFLRNALVRVRNKIAYSGTASSTDRTIAVRNKTPVVLGGYDPDGGTNYELPIGQAVFYMVVSAVEDDIDEEPETVIASLSGKPATVVIFDKDIEFVPYLQVRPANPAVTGRIGARKANFTVTNYGAATDKAFNFYVSRTGAVASPAGVTRGGSATTGLVSEHQFPAGAKGQSMSLSIAVDEVSLKDSEQTVTARIVEPSSGQSSYKVGTPNSATVHLTSHASIVQRTRQVIARHMNRVAALMTGDTGRARLRDRQQARSSSDGGAQPYRLGGSLTDQQDQVAGNVAFATSTDRLRGAAQAEKRRRVTESGIDASKYSLGRNNAATSSPAWDVWVTGKYSYERTGKGADRSSGHTGLMRAGADFLLDPETLVGVMAQYDTSKDKSSQQGFEVSGHGWMVGPYLEKQLSSNIYFDAKVLGGKSSNEVSPFATYTDSFDTTRWLAAARLTGYWSLGQWQFTPSAEIVTYQDRQAAYTDSNGLEIGGQTLRVNRINFGPEISRRFVTSDGVTIEPRLAVRGLWRFGGKRSNVDTSGPNSIAVDPVELDGVQGRVEAGVNVRTPGGVSVDLEGSYDGIGSSERSAASVSGRVRVPLQ